MLEDGHDSTRGGGVRGGVRGGVLFAPVVYSPRDQLAVAVGARFCPRRAAVAARRSRELCLVLPRDTWALRFA